VHLRASPDRWQTLQPGDALIIVDVQNDFLPGGALAVPHGDEVIAPLNGYLREYARLHLPVFATRDWHPPGHCSFHEQGGPWPPHCVAGTEGAELASGVRLPGSTRVISKATRPESDAYSAFQGTDLAQQLHDAGVTRVLIGGLATDYCVRATALDALAEMRAHGAQIIAAPPIVECMPAAEAAL